MRQLDHLRLLFVTLNPNIEPRIRNKSMKARMKLYGIQSGAKTQIHDQVITFATLRITRMIITGKRGIVSFISVL